VQNYPQKTLDKNLAVWYNQMAASLLKVRPLAARQKDASFLHLRPKERRIYYE